MFEVHRPPPGIFGSSSRYRPDSSKRHGNPVRTTGYRNTMTFRCAIPLSMGDSDYGKRQPRWVIRTEDVVGTDAIQGASKLRTRCSLLLCRVGQDDATPPSSASFGIDKRRRDQDIATPQIHASRELTGDLRTRPPSINDVVITVPIEKPEPSPREGRGKLDRSHAVGGLSFVRVKGVDVYHNTGRVRCVGIRLVAQLWTRRLG